MGLLVIPTPAERGVSGYLQHESVWRVDKDGGVVLRGGLQAELGVCGAGVVGEGDAGGQLAVVQQRLMMLLKEKVALCPVLERSLHDSKK